MTEMTTMTTTKTAFSTEFLPSSLERAFAYYLLDQQFHAPQPFYISGRIAVPFLSTSGVDRVLLREIWNLVDPLMQGSLSEEIQWIVVLKLVALAQMGRCDLSQYEYCLCHISSPLPTFSQTPMPTPAWLLTRYGSGIGVGIEPLSTGPTERLSVTDAFGDITVQDAPLPALQQIGFDNDKREEDDDFGGFEQAPINEILPSKPLPIKIDAVSDMTRSEERRVGKEC